VRAVGRTFREAAPTADLASGGFFRHIPPLPVTPAVGQLSINIHGASMQIRLSVFLAIFLAAVFLMGCFAIQPTLSEAILTADYVRENYFPEISSTIFFREPGPIENDTTIELGDKCSLDCTQKTWQINNSSKLSIALVKVESPTDAKNKVQEVASAFSQQNKSTYQFDDEMYQKINNRLGLPDYTYIATTSTAPSSTNSINFFLVTNRGPIVIIISDELFFGQNVTDIDLFSHVVAIQSLAQLQNKKLQSMGYP
jgi:uncharacterized protein YqkB